MLQSVILVSLLMICDGIFHITFQFLAINSFKSPDFIHFLTSRVLNMWLLNFILGLIQTSDLESCPKVSETKPLADISELEF